MRTAWNAVKEKFNLNISFQRYFNHIGKPFEKILESLNIIENRSDIKKEFYKISIKNFAKIKLYKDVKKTIEFLKKKKIKTAIVTSKNFKRTKLILNRFKIKVDIVQCPNKKLRGKPFPDQILKVIKKMKMKKKECMYVGDTKFDKIGSRKSGIDFVLAYYGYKIGIKNHKIKIRNITQVKNFI